MKDVITYKGFIGSVHFASEDRVFYGKVEGINDLISFEGRTVDELEEGFRYMVDEHIKDCKKKHLPLEKSYKGNLNIRLAPELHKKAAHNAALKGISLNLGFRICDFGFFLPNAMTVIKSKIQNPKS